jgi:hypothetical protein
MDGAIPVNTNKALCLENALVLCSALVSSNSWAEESLAKKSQNPLGPFISVNPEYNYLLQNCMKK